MYRILRWAVQSLWIAAGEIVETVVNSVKNQPSSPHPAAAAVGVSTLTPTYYTHSYEHQIYSNLPHTNTSFLHSIHTAYNNYYILYKEQEKGVMK